MGKGVTVGGLSGVAFLALGLGLPRIFEGLPNEVHYGLVAIGAILLLITFIWSMLNKRSDGLNNQTHGPGAHIFSGPVSNPTFYTNTVPSKFAAECEMTTAPTSLGGRSVIDLDGIATLRLMPPYSRTSVTVALDMVPIKHPNRIEPDAQITDVHLYIGQSKRFFFDTDHNKRHTMEAGGKIFIVTLREIELLQIEGVANPLRFRFAVKEA